MKSFPLVTAILRAGMRALLSGPRRPRRVLSGAFRGLMLSIDPATETQVWLGLFEREAQPFLEPLTRDVATGIDIGAAAGEYAVYLLARTRAQVIAVEPQPELSERLRENVRSNDSALLSRLTVIEQYLGLPGREGAISLARLLADAVRPVFIKLDVDGAEVDILQSAADALPDRQIRWLIEVHSHELERRCIELFQAAGREVRIVDNAPWRAFIPEQRPIELNRWLVIQ